MNYDLDKVNDALRPMIRTWLGLPENSVRPAKQSNAPAEDMSTWITVLITEAGGEGQDQHFYKPADNDLVTEYAEGTRLLMVSIQVFGDNANHLATRLKTLLTMEGPSATLRGIGLGFIRTIGPRDLTEVNNALWEPRSSLDLHLYMTAQEQVDVATYGTFPIELKTETSTINSEVFEP